MTIRNQMGPRALLATAILLLLTLTIAACGADTGDPADLLDEDAMELPAEAQQAIALSQEALANELGIDADEIELESITEPATADDPFIVRLRINGEIHEYHVRAGEALRVSDPLPTAPAE